MNEQNYPPITIDLVEALRQLASVNQQIAQSLAELQKLYADELIKRDADRKEMAADRLDWKEKQKQSEERYLQQNKERQQFKLPPLPWQMKLFWGMVFLLLVLGIFLFACQLIVMVIGGTV